MGRRVQPVCIIFKEYLFSLRKTSGYTSRCIVVLEQVPEKVWRGGLWVVLNNGGRFKFIFRLR